MNPTLGPPLQFFGTSTPNFAEERARRHKEGPVTIRTEPTMSIDSNANRAPWKPLFAVLKDVWLLLRPIVNNLNSSNPDRKIKVCGVQHLSMMPPSSPSEVCYFLRKQNVAHKKIFWPSLIYLCKWQAECGFELLVSGVDAIHYYSGEHWEAEKGTSEYWVVRVGIRFCAFVLPTL